MDLGLRDKVVIVTGSAQGIGEAVARTFAAEGALVALVDIADTAKLARELSGASGRAIALKADVTRSEDVDAAVRSTLEAFGRVDVLVNNAGVLREAYVSETSDALWDMMLAVNLKSVFLLCRAVAPTMMRQRSGCMLNASSFAAVVPSAGHGAYAAAKAGVISLSKTLAGELGPYGIRVVAYIPGVIATALTANMRETGSEQMLRTIAAGRFGSAQDVANVLALLASEPAAYVNGAVVEISGGKLAVQNVAAAQAKAGAAI
jgi:3-oxoacyl-[acyl-carrier protein] reductase